MHTIRHQSTLKPRPDMAYIEFTLEQYQSLPKKAQDLLKYNGREYRRGGWNTPSVIEIPKRCIPELAAAMTAEDKDKRIL